MAGIHRLDRTVLRVSGHDAVAFLDNLLTQNAGDIEGGARYAALLTPQGKVFADMFLWPAKEGVLIDTARSYGDDLARKLAMYKLRAAVTVENASDRHAVLWSETPFDGASADPRLPALGWRALGPATPAAADDAEYDRHRLRLGVPELARDAGPDEVFGLEALLEELNGVDFAKGCFVGQENVSRMKRRATTRKKFCPIAFEGPPPPPLTPIMAGAAEIGTVRSGVDGRAIALLRLDRADEAQKAGVGLTAGPVAVALDPPPWLLLPESDEN